MGRDTEKHITYDDDIINVYPSNDPATSDRENQALARSASESSHIRSPNTDQSSPCPFPLPDADACDVCVNLHVSDATRCSTESHETAGAPGIRRADHSARRMMWGGSAGRGSGERGGGVQACGKSPVGWMTTAYVYHLAGCSANVQARSSHRQSSGQVEI